MLDKVLEGGGEPAVAVGDRGLTYGELREAAARRRRELDGAERVASGPSPRSRPASRPSPRSRAGRPLVPVNPKLGRSELEHVLTDSAPDV